MTLFVLKNKFINLEDTIWQPRCLHPWSAPPFFSLPLIPYEAIKTKINESHIVRHFELRFTVSYFTSYNFKSTCFQILKLICLIKRFFSLFKNYPSFRQPYLFSVVLPYSFVYIYFTTSVLSHRRENGET